MTSQYGVPVPYVFFSASAREIHSLFTCALLGTSCWFRKVVLLLALFRSSLHAHFKNSVTQVSTAFESTDSKA